MRESADTPAARPIARISSPGHESAGTAALEISLKTPSKADTYSAPSSLTTMADGRLIVPVPFAVESRTRVMVPPGSIRNTALGRPLT